MQGGRKMKGIRFVVVVLALALIVVFVAGGAGQTQGPGESDAAAVRSGTIPTGEEGSSALTSGAVQQVEVEPRSVESTIVSIRIPAAALRPIDSDVEWHAFYDWPNTGCVYASSGDQYTAWMAPLYLPDGATIRLLRMYYNDQHETIDCTGYVTVFDAWGEIVTQWPVYSSATGRNYGEAELEHVVDYDRYSYVVKWYPNVIGDVMQVCGFRVFYETPWGLAFLPYVTNGD
jgi:hypothetical protein